MKDDVKKIRYYEGKLNDYFYQINSLKYKIDRFRYEDEVPYNTYRQPEVQIKIYQEKMNRVYEKIIDIYKKIRELENSLNVKRS